MPNPAADKAEIMRAAAHEVGHAMISAELGANVYYVVIHRDGSGISETDVPRSPIVDLKLTLAGYIAEAIFEHEEPTFEGMVGMISNEDDVADVERILGDGRIKAEIALPKAFQYVVDYFSMPQNLYRLRHLAAKLAKTKYMGGYHFNRRVHV